MLMLVLKKQNNLPKKAKLLFGLTAGYMLLKR